MNHFTLINLPTFCDSRGDLTVSDGVLPFVPVRMYWIYGADGKTRGGHRHHKTRQALIAVTGSVSIYINDGSVEQTIVLDNPKKCLLVEPKDWHTMTFGADSVLLVMSSHSYDRSDYIDSKYE
jgi:hypothetical protein